MNREGGAQGSGHFGSKTAECSAWCGQVSSEIIHYEMGKCWWVFKNNYRSQMLPLTTTPADTVIQMGPLNTHLAGEPVLQGACPLEDNSCLLDGGPPSFSFQYNVNTVVIACSHCSRSTEGGGAWQRWYWSGVPSFLEEEMMPEH